jgi:hypothetical protein
MAKAVGFTAESADRIANVVRKVERGTKGKAVGWYDYDGPAEPVIGKTEVEWKKGTRGAFLMYSGKPGYEQKTPNTIYAFNLFADIPAGKWVACVGGYVIAAEC